MNDLQIFSNPRFGEIRTIEENGKVLFCGRDVAAALGYAKPQKAISDHCKGALKRSTPTNGGIQEMLFIPEGDIYRLAAKSELPGAEEFESWIFDEVLPSIRKHGAYMTAETIERTLTDPDYLIQLATTLKTEREARMLAEHKIEQDKPKVLFADSVAGSKTSILVRDLAKLICQNGVSIGGTRLFKWLRSNGYLISTGRDYNSPSQRSMDMKLMEIREINIDHSEYSETKKTPLITGKGQQYFINKFLGVEA